MKDLERYSMPIVTKKGGGSRPNIRQNMSVKESIHQEDVAIIAIYISNMGLPKYLKN